MHDDIYDHDHPDNFVIGEDEIVTEIEGLEMFSLKSVGVTIDRRPSANSSTGFASCRVNVRPSSLTASPRR